jgi:hypothetical protein
LIGLVLGAVAIIFGIVMTIAWILVPFSVIGVKPLLRQLIEDARRTNSLLESAARSRRDLSQFAQELDRIRPER